MWWSIEPAHRAEFEHWHAHQHFPERLRIPGFLRATRWREADGGDGVLVTYELTDHPVLSSQAYLDHLNAPTDWSRRMMPHHKGMIRGQCQVIHSRGAFIGAHLLALRLAPAADVAEADALLLDRLGGLLDRLPSQPGLTGAHFLRHQEPRIAQTTEQRIRGGDRGADWVLLVSGYALEALRALAADTLSPDRLAAIGAVAAQPGLYSLAVSALPQDLADVQGIQQP